MSDDRFITEDKRCAKCGTRVERFNAEPAEQVVSSRGFILTLSMWYTLKPCGHTFRKVNTGEVAQ